MVHAARRESPDTKVRDDMAGSVKDRPLNHDWQCIFTRLKVLHEDLPPESLRACFASA